MKIPEVAKNHQHPHQVHSCQCVLALMKPGKSKTFMHKFSVAEELSSIHKVHYQFLTVRITYK